MMTMGKSALLAFNFAKKKTIDIFFRHSKKEIVAIMSKKIGHGIGIFMFYPSFFHWNIDNGAET